MKKIKAGKKNTRQSDPPGYEDKQVAAYYRWQKRGAPIGDDLADWMAVERGTVEGEEEEEWEEERRGEGNPQDEEPGEVP